jgi:hypothetical protein
LEPDTGHRRTNFDKGRDDTDDDMADDDADADNDAGAKRRANTTYVDGLCRRPRRVGVVGFGGRGKFSAVVSVAVVGGGAA